MRSPAAAFAWEFGRRHRWGFIAFVVYFTVLATINVFFLGHRRVDFDNVQTFALAVVVPLATSFIYFLAVFSYGLAGDLAARQSMYPTRLFTLPVTTNALAGWPMFYGSIAMAILWIAFRFLGVWPSDAYLPVIWPMFLGASLLAWTQALTWMSYPLPGLRVIVTVLWLASIDAIVMLALHFKASEAVMLAIVVPHVPLAFLVARFAVARARRGDVPDWSRPFARVRSIADFVTRRNDDFRSAARAQMWFEWRLHGRSLPALVAILLPFELSLLFVFRETPGIVFEILISVLFTPLFMAAFVAATVSKSNLFMTTRPLTSASLVAAKLKATIVSTVVAWLFVLIAIPIGLRLSDTSSIVMDRWHRLLDSFGSPHAIAIVLVVLSALVASTWKQLVHSLYIGMSGREWIAKASVFIALSFLGVLFPFVHWLLRSRVAMAYLWNALPWIAAAFVAIKLSIATWIAARLHDTQLVSDRAIVLGAACWDAIVFAVYALLVWLLPSILFRGYFLALIAILAVPLTRLSAAPLALAWNRHR